MYFCGTLSNQFANNEKSQSELVHFRFSLTKFPLDLALYLLAISLEYRPVCSEFIRKCFYLHAFRQQNFNALAYFFYKYVQLKNSVEFIEIPTCLLELKLYYSVEFEIFFPFPISEAAAYVIPKRIDVDDCLSGEGEDASSPTVVSTMM